MNKGTVTVGFLHPGTMSSCFVKSKTDLLFYDAAHHQRIVSHAFGEMGLEAHAARIHQARNEVAKAVLDNSESEWLFFIDSDMGFAPDTVERLIQSADRKYRPVIGGLCFGQKSDGAGEFYARRFRMQPTLFRMYETDETVGFIPMFDYPRGQLVEVDATGGACVLIHRSVLDTLRSEFGDTWFTPMTVPKGEGGSTEFSEDISFFIRLKAAGVKTYVHTGVKTTHDKHGLFLDEETFDLQQAFFRMFPKDDPL